MKSEMNEKYPKLISQMNPKLRTVAGILKDVVKEEQKYSDKDIIARGRMEDWDTKKVRRSED